MVCAIVSCADSLSVYALFLLCLMLAARQMSIGGEAYDVAFDTVVAQVAQHNPVVHSALERDQLTWELDNQVHKSDCYGKWSHTFLLELQHELCQETPANEDGDADANRAARS